LSAEVPRETVETGIHAVSLFLRFFVNDGSLKFEKFNGERVERNLKNRETAKWPRLSARQGGKRAGPCIVRSFALNIDERTAKPGSTLALKAGGLTRNV
jgi:hypothetical protein